MQISKMHYTTSIHMLGGAVCSIINWMKSQSNPYYPRNIYPKYQLFIIKFLISNIWTIHQRGIFHTKRWIPDNISEI